LEQYAILLVRVSIGLFFAISGADKLFVACYPAAQTGPTVSNPSLVPFRADG
jgi:uncharacterized membrane protein YphA (DoxX/SURF4 family)